MKSMLLKIMMMTSSTIFLMKTPMTLGILLLLHTTMSTILVSKITVSSWMSMIMFLMLIGGMLILFMYMSSIASNEKFKPNIKISMILLGILLPTEEFLYEIYIQESQMYFMLNESSTLSKLYNKKTMFITMMMFMYLLLSMIVVTKIIKIYEGPLRAKYE